MTREIDALGAQCAQLSALLDELSDEDWDRPTRCPGWTVMELAVHCEGMLQRLVGANSEEVEGSPEIDRVGYYAYDPDGPRDGEDPNKTFSEVIQQRVIDEVGGRSGEEIRASLSSAIDSALAGVRTIPGDRVIKRSGHPRMRFDEFIASRVLEFGIHTMDVGHATLRGERLHPDAAQIVKEILDGRLDAELPKGLGWDTRTFILSGTGRRRLESNERFVLGPLAAKFPLLA
ncbi:MAG TPA: maleylpyruvate isomerase family mycothiol-dependent enzyme [Actinomycetota bacterium]|nr:maleylpyruvate isomerase family mycothiol-dependent enzyme [Actinomycetota bacterium]